MLLRAPEEVAGIRKRIKGKRVKDFGTTQMAIKQCAHALASSYGTVPLEYPIFGEFLATLLRLGTDPGKQLRGLLESWKPRIEEKIFIDREEAISAIIKRYGISAEDIERVEALLREVVSLPAYVEDEVFDALCEIDY